MRHLLHFATIMCCLPAIAQLVPTEFDKAGRGDLAPPATGSPITIYSLQSSQGGVANVSAEAIVYLAVSDWQMYSVFLNFNATDGLLFPGVMLADNMGLGNGFQAGIDHISSYSLRMWRSSSDPQPGLADFHVELWDGDPFCQFDTPGGGFSCAPIAGTGADFIDIPANTVFRARHVLPKGITPPNQRVWMVVSGSQTGNSSPCRLGWDVTLSSAIIGDNEPADVFLQQDDANNGVDGPSGQGSCCSDGSTCDVNSLCPSDPTGEDGHCSDNFAESPHVYTIGTGPGTRCDRYAGSGCANFTATIRAEATTTISLVPVSTSAGTIVGHEVILPGGRNSVELEIRIGNWDLKNEGTLLKAWEADIDSRGYYTGFQGFLTPTTVDCTTDDDCKAAFGGVCSILGDACITDSDCAVFPIEKCTGSKCGFPVAGPNANTQCERGFIFTGRADYVYIAAGGDLPAVDISSINYRYASAVQSGGGVSASAFDPFPATGVYAGTLRLDTSKDCKGTFTVGFKPPPASVLVNQDSEFIPLVGFVPAKITCEIGRCCFDLDGLGQCAENVTAAQCDALPGPARWDPDPTVTCDDSCIECVDDASCQDGVWCNGNEVCDPYRECQPGPPRCDDGVPCTTDVCNENDSSCTFLPDDAVCDDDDFCNGQERCDSVTGCQRRPSPCSPELCDEDTDTCAPPPIPTVSAWGIIILTGMLLVLAKVCFRARPGVAT